MMDTSLQLPIPVTVQVFLSALTVYLRPTATVGSIGFGFSVVVTEELLSDETEEFVVCSGGRVWLQAEKIKI